jgi:hypothetical protein
MMAPSNAEAYIDGFWSIALREPVLIGLRVQHLSKLYGMLFFAAY